MGEVSQEGILHDGSIILVGRRGKMIHFGLELDMHIVEEAPQCFEPTVCGEKVP